MVGLLSLVWMWATQLSAPPIQGAETASVCVPQIRCGTGTVSPATAIGAPLDERVERVDLGEVSVAQADTEPESDGHALPIAGDGTLHEQAATGPRPCFESFAPPCCHRLALTRAPPVARDHGCQSTPDCVDRRSDRS